MRILDDQGCKVSSCGQRGLLTSDMCIQRRLKSDCASAQSDLSCRWTHMSEDYVFKFASRVIILWRRALVPRITKAGTSGNDVEISEALY